ncbi:MAG: hypothetical protein ABIV28_06540 [Longimicrobiales bacterium]
MKNREFQKNVRRSVTMLVVTSMTFAGCDKDKKPDTGPTTTDGAAAPDTGKGPTRARPFMDHAHAGRCDTELFTKFAKDTAIATIRNAALVSSEYLLTNEVHDCQRLITGTTLGPLVAILVDTARSRTGSFGNGVVADILNYDEAPYAYLSIKPALSCLWIQKGTEEDGSDWVAAVRQPVVTGGCPSETFNGAPDPATVLIVKRMKQIGGGVYPTTGRWMWDSIGHNQFIGIRCGDAWCEMGPKGYKSHTVITNERSVPGWYDQQMMTYLPQGSTTLTLSNLFGTIRPASGIGSSNPTSSSGAHVANLEFDGTDAAALAAFRTKFGFSGNRGPLNFRIASPVPGDTATRRFRMGNSGAWKKLVYNPHTQHAGKRIVRWAWSETDEMAWFPCDVGCCRTED